MKKKIRWGILSTAKIAVEKVIPAIQAGKFGTVVAIASREAGRAAEAARNLGIETSYGSYLELLDDASIDAVYNPLPNNLHFEWTARAAGARKHVLCEKPIGLNAGEVRKMITLRDKIGVCIQEAFMVRTHPTWLAVRDLIRSGRIGEVRAITGFFSYFNDDHANIRNKLETGGGALLDIGCYCINAARFIFETEPERVSGLMAKDSVTGVDSLTSAMLEFPGGHAAFTCSTKLVPFQRMQFFGTKGRIEIEIPFNIPLETPTRIFVDDGSDLYGESIEMINIDAANQYTIQSDLFSRAILENAPQAVSLEDSFKNMAAIEAVFRSAETGVWETPESL